MSDLWEEFVVWVPSPYVKGQIPMCGLCGNTGTLDTTQSARTPVGGGGVPCGVKTWCICPNGRRMKDRANPPKEKLYDPDEHISGCKGLEETSHCSRCGYCEVDGSCVCYTR